MKWIALFLLMASSAYAAEVKLMWDKNDDGASGYELYYGKRSGVYTGAIDVGGVTSFAVSGLEPATKYYFSAAAYGPGKVSYSALADEISATTPSVPMTANFGAVATPVTIQFSDKSQGAVTSRLWDFGDGTTSTCKNPLKTYANQSYVVKLTVRGPKGSKVISRTVVSAVPKVVCGP